MSFHLRSGWSDQHQNILNNLSSYFCNILDNRQRGSWDGGWGANRPTFRRNPEEGKKKGTLITRNGFEVFLPAMLSKDHCAPFHALSVLAREIVQKGILLWVDGPNLIEFWRLRM